MNFPDAPLFSTILRRIVENSADFLDFHPDVQDCNMLHAQMFRI